MPGYLTTHVLDTARGRPAAGLAIELFRLEGESRLPLRTVSTDADGRTGGPILPESDFAIGTYELVFHAGAYLDALAGAAAGTAGTAGGTEAAPRFLGTIPIRFGMFEAAHYHVPLLLSPFGYSTYRGS